MNTKHFHLHLHIGLWPIYQLILHQDHLAWEPWVEPVHIQIWQQPYRTGTKPQSTMNLHQRFLRL